MGEHPRLGDRLAIALFVLVLHGLGLSAFLAKAPPIYEQPPLGMLQLQILPSHPARKAISPPRFNPSPPSIDIAQTPRIAGSTEMEGTSLNVIAPASAPRLDLNNFVNPTPYAVKAGLAAGVSVTVLLTIEVLEDGSTGKTACIANCDDLAIRDAALEYAAHFHWFPGTAGGRAKTMLVRIPVVLSALGAASA